MAESLDACKILSAHPIAPAVRQRVIQALAAIKFLDFVPEMSQFPFSTG